MHDLAVKRIAKKIPEVSVEPQQCVNLRSRKKKIIVHHWLCHCIKQETEDPLRLRIFVTM